MKKDGALDGFLKYISDWEIIKRNRWLYDFLGYPARRKPDGPIDTENLHAELAEMSKNSAATQRKQLGEIEHEQWLREFREKSPFVNE